MGMITDALLRSYKTSPKRINDMSAMMAFPEGKKVGKSNVRMFRRWSETSEWVRAAINVRKNQVSSAEWDIVPFDQTKNVDNIRLKNRIKQLFDVPNANQDSFRSFMEPIIEDICVLDAGVIEKVRNLRQEPAELIAVDGGKIKVSAVWDGSNVKEPRYYWYARQDVVVGDPDATFTNNDMVYIMSNPRTYTVVGLSPLETLKMTVDAELSGSEYNRRQVTSAAPDGMLYLGDEAPPDKVEGFKTYWNAEVAGRGALAFLGGGKNPEFINFRNNNRDMQFLEWQTYLVRKIAAVFGLSPQDLGVTFDINRANGEVLDQQTEDRGIRTLLSLIQDYLTREIVWDPAFGGSANNLAFRFTRLNLKESLTRAQIDKLALGGVPWKTVNEARVADGFEPLPGDIGNQLIMATPVGAVSLADVPTSREAIEGKSRGSQGEPPAAPSGAKPRPSSPAGSQGARKEN